MRSYVPLRERLFWIDASQAVSDVCGTPVTGGQKRVKSWGAAWLPELPAARLTLRVDMVRRWLTAGGTFLALVATSAIAQQPAVAPQATVAPKAAPPQGAVTKPLNAGNPVAKSVETPKPATKAATKKSTHKKAPEKVETPEPVVEAPPPPPPTPEESPAVAPQVSFQNGELSIRSDNATLSSILSAVKAQTGASVEAPGTTSSERIATHLGPGDPRDVLTTLLNNSKYDYILLGAPGNPTSVQKIILTARAAGAGNAAGNGANAARPAQRANFQIPAEVQQENNDQELPDAEIPDDASQPEPPQPEQPEQPEQQQPTDQTQPGAANQQKTPEQLLQELQRMQQQQQQQQEQQRQQNLNPQ